MRRFRVGGMGTVISLRPITGALRKYGGQPFPDLSAIAQDEWEISPGGMSFIRPAFVLPGHLERITATMFADLEHSLRVLRGGFEVRDGPTMGYRARDVDLIDGVLFGHGAERHLRPRARRRPTYRVPREAISGAIYESWNGNRWFGPWLHEDCLTYRLAEAAGQPVTAMPASRYPIHGPTYEARLNMWPRRVGDVHFDELTFFFDEPNNPGKADRARDLRRRLMAGRDIPPVPGVFLLRGGTGDVRIMLNERQVAERLATDYGFLVVDPSTATVDELVAACAQAEVVAGIEGSQIAHGTVLMRDDALMFTLQPPDRACVTFKIQSDRREQDFAIVIGHGNHERFTVEWDDIRRTLDLALEARQGGSRIGPSQR